MNYYAKYKNLKTYNQWYKKLNDFYSKKDKPENFEFLDAYEQFRQSIGFYLSYLLDEPVISPPAVLQLNLIFRCNYRCTMCSISGSAEENLYPTKIEKEKEMNIEKAKNLLDQARDMGVKEVLLLGGEPLLYDDIFEIIEYSIKQGLEPTLITNASLITEKIAEKLVKSGLPSVRASLDGAIQSTHDDVRGIKKGFDRTVNGIKNIVKIKKKLKSDSPHVGITFTIMDRNAKEIIPITKLAIELGLDGLNFQPVCISNTNPYNYSKKEESPLWPKKENISLILKQIDEIILFKEGKRDWLKEKLPSKNPYYYLENPIGHLKAMQSYFKKELTLDENPCYAGYNRLQITQYGQLYLCSDVFGNVYEEKLEDLFFSARAKKARQLIRVCYTPCNQWCSFDIKSRVYANNIPSIANYYFKILDTLMPKYKKEYYFEILKQTRDLIDDCCFMLKEEKNILNPKDKKRKLMIIKALKDLKIMFSILETREGKKIKENKVKIFIRSLIKNITS